MVRCIVCHEEFDPKNDGVFFRAGDEKEFSVVRTIQRGEKQFQPCPKCLRAMIWFWLVCEKKFDLKDVELKEEEDV